MDTTTIPTGVAVAFLHRYRPHIVEEQHAKAGHEDRTTGLTDIYEFKIQDRSILIGFHHDTAEQAVVQTTEPKDLALFWSHQTPARDDLLRVTQ